jgi:hypothetical protein
LATFAHARAVPEKEGSAFAGLWEAKLVLRSGKADGIELCVGEEAPKDGLAAEVELVSCLRRGQAAHASRFKKLAYAA